MKRFGLLALAALAGIGVASPALADWDTIGSIDVGYGADRDTASPDFGGPVARLRFTARGGDIQCRTIRATYGNGASSDLFGGILRQGQPHGVDLPGDARTVRRLDFVCHAFSRGGAKLQMEADIGQYHAQWRANPNWNSMWSRYMHWRDDVTNNWVSIGSAQFAGRDDRDGGAVGLAGRSISMLAFRPMNGDAVCMRANVRFGSGQVQAYAINGGRPMTRGSTYKIDLPGDQRNVTNVVLRCHALGQYAVTVNIYGDK